jgi:uncharacterized phage protein gp47/JayE
MAFGVTEDGFVKKRLEDIRSALEVSYKAVYGNDLDTSAESVAGQEIATLAGVLVEIWDALQANYTALDPAGSNGISLDRVAQYIAVERIGASQSRVTAVATGTEGTLLAAGQQASQAESEEFFTSTEDVTISKSLAVLADVSVVTVADSTTYTITIAGSAFPYTSDASATESEILNGLQGEIAANGVPVVATVNGSILEIRSEDYMQEFDVSLTANLQIDVIGSKIIFDADDFGTISVPENTLTNIETPVSGWDAVDNFIAGATGRDQETDEEFRLRRRLVTQATGAGTPEAIRNFLLANVDGIASALVVENRTDLTDVDGRPPHSFETVVSGGDDQDIANSIWEVGPAGIQTFGNITKTVVDSQNIDQSISFSRATDVYIWLDIEFTRYDEETFPDSGIQLIKDAILAYAQIEYTIGKDVILGRLKTPIYTVEGIEDITIEAFGSTNPGATPSYSSSNISIGGSQQAIFTDSRMTVVDITP